MNDEWKERADMNGEWKEAVIQAALAHDREVRFRIDTEGKIHRYE